MIRVFFSRCSRVKILVYCLFYLLLCTVKYWFWFWFWIFVCILSADQFLRGWAIPFIRCFYSTSRIYRNRNYNQLCCSKMLCVSQIACAARTACRKLRAHVSPGAKRSRPLGRVWHVSVFLERARLTVSDARRMTQPSPPPPTSAPIDNRLMGPLTLIWPVHG